LIAMLDAVMASMHPDYYLIKYAAADGATIWEADWGVSGGDFPNDMKLDSAGDIYVTGTGIDFIDKFSTVKFAGSDGRVIWQAYDSAGPDNAGAALALDGQGGVYVTGSTDPDGDHSNFNDNIFTVARDASNGALRWTHVYGQNCIGCFDVSSDVAADSAGHVFVVGRTNSAPYSADAITLVLDAASGVEIARGIVSGGANQTAASRFVRFDAAQNVFEGAEFYDANTGQLEFVVFEYSALDPQVVYCTSKINSQGCSPAIASFGVPSASSNAGFSVRATNELNQKSGLLFYGVNGRASSPFQGGTLCVAAPIKRAPPQNSGGSSSGSDCTGAFSIDMNAFASGVLGGAPLAALQMPGTTVDCQWWSRDPGFAPPDNTSLSDALEYVVEP
jgi:hypothetical protein